MSVGVGVGVRILRLLRRRWGFKTDPLLSATGPGFNRLEGLKFGVWSGVLLDPMAPCGFGRQRREGQNRPADVKLYTNPVRQP